MKVFAARFCDCTPHSAFGVLSLHQSPETAQAAIDAHRAAEKADWLTWADAEWQKTNPWTDEHGAGSQAWDVFEYEVKP